MTVFWLSWPPWQLSSDHVSKSPWNKYIYTQHIYIYMLFTSVYSYLDKYQGPLREKIVKICILCSFCSIAEFFLKWVWSPLQPTVSGSENCFTSRKHVRDSNVSLLWLILLIFHILIIFSYLSHAIASLAFMSSFMIIKICWPLPEILKNWVSSSPLLPCCLLLLIVKPYLWWLTPTTWLFIFQNQCIPIDTRSPHQ